MSTSVFLVGVFFFKHFGNEFCEEALLILFSSSRYREYTYFSYIFYILFLLLRSRINWITNKNTFQRYFLCLMIVIFTCNVQITIKYKYHIITICSGLCGRIRPNMPRRDWLRIKKWNASFTNRNLNTSDLHWECISVR